MCIHDLILFLYLLGLSFGEWGWNGYPLTLYQHSPVGLQVFTLSLCAIQNALVYPLVLCGCGQGWAV